MNILEFSRTISDDLQNYDLNGACKHLNTIQEQELCIVVSHLGPVLMDEYVEWRKARLAANKDTP